MQFLIICFCSGGYFKWNIVSSSKPSRNSQVKSSTGNILELMILNSNKYSHHSADEKSQHLPDILVMCDVKVVRLNCQTSRLDEGGCGIDRDLSVSLVDNRGNCSTQVDS